MNIRVLTDRQTCNEIHSALVGEKCVRNWHSLLIAIDIYTNIRVCWGVTGSGSYSYVVREVLCEASISYFCLVPKLCMYGPISPLHHMYVWLYLSNTPYLCMALSLNYAICMYVWPYLSITLYVCMYGPISPLHHTISRRCAYLSIQTTLLFHSCSARIEISRDIEHQTRLYINRTRDEADIHGRVG
jgi:hypothetical protein